ncbi:MAG: MotE family protein [Pseudomonadota bacterium]
MKQINKFLQITTIAGCLLGASLVQAQEMNSSEMLKAIDELPVGSEAEITRLCGNILDPVREQRYALQVAELEELQTKIQERIDLLETKRAELEQWATKREEFAKQASSMLVDVYANMKPDAAAERLETIDGGLTAALMMKLKPRSAAAILSEMNKDKAALITRIMAASADTSSDET